MFFFSRHTVHGSDLNLDNYGVFQQTQSGLNRALETFSVSFLDDTRQVNSIQTLREERKVMTDVFHLLNKLLIKNNGVLKYSVILNCQFERRLGAAEENDIAYIQLRTKMVSLNSEQMMQIEYIMERKFQELELREEQLQLSGSGRL